MNTLREALEEYIALRQSLGFKMHDAGRVLSRFVAFMEEYQAPHITTRLALQWARQAKTVQPAERARRLCFVRGFARYRSATDPRTEVPSPGLLPYRSTRARPYLYTEQEVQGLLEAALQLPTAWPSTPLRPWVFHCLLGLLSVTGLRISEALDLKLDDVDLEEGVLTIRAAKFGRSRLVPLHPSTRTVLVHYLQRRQQFLGTRHSDYVFVSNRGTARPRSRSSSLLHTLAADRPAGGGGAQRPTAARLPPLFRQPDYSGTEPRGRLFGRMSHSPSRTWRNNQRGRQETQDAIVGGANESICGAKWLTRRRLVALSRHHRQQSSH